MKSKNQMMSTALNLLMLFALVASFSACSSDEVEYYDDSKTLASRKTRANGECNEDNELISIEYPTKAQILAQLKGTMDGYWSMTKQNATRSVRYEYGFIIYYDYRSGRIYAGPKVTGTATPGHLGAEIYIPVDDSDARICGVFHTHTPVTYTYVGYSRDTGPSPADSSAAIKYPEFVYDYTISKVAYGHDKDLDAMIYTYGPDKRMDTTFVIGH